MIEQTFIMTMPFIFMVIAMAFNNTVFAFFGGLWAIFAGLTILDTPWVAFIYIGLGIYFILAGMFFEWEE